MKRFLAFFLILATLLSLASCAAEEKKTTTEEADPLLAAPPALKETQSEEEEVTTDDGVRVYATADDPLTRAKLEAIPIANSSMTTDELRQICIQYIKLSVSFQWIPSTDMTLGDDSDTYRAFREGRLEGGIPYINTASGNLYRILEYYDESTGILNTTWLGKNSHYFGTACSGTAGWAWYRVVNSAEISWTHSMNVAHGFVPVGPYTYDHSLDKIWTSVNGERVYHYSNKDICKKNGEQIMYQSYAATLPADCFSSNGHVRMSVELPVVVYNEDGTINGEKSYVMQAEQGLYNTAAHHKRYTADGTEYLIRGNDGRAFTFAELFKDGYIPHTFKEFIGEDPVEKGSVTIPYSGETATAKDLAQGTLVSNYSISDVFTIITDKDGKVVFNYAKRAENHFTKSMSMSKTIPFSYFNKYEDGTYTIEIKVQISTGELISVYKGTLVEG